MKRRREAGQPSVFSGKAEARRVKYESLRVVEGGAGDCSGVGV